MRVLLCAGASVSTTDYQGRTPLQVSALACHTDIMELLLAGGSDVHAVDSRGRSALFRATRAPDILVKDTHGNMSGSTAAAKASGGVKAVSILLEAGCDPNLLTEDGQTAIFASKNLEVVKALLDRGASVKFIDRIGSSVLHCAGAVGASAAVLCTLYKAGADVTLRSHAGYTAADVAMMYGYPDAAKMLELLAAKHQPPADAPPRRPVREGQLKAELPTMTFRDEDGRETVLLVEDYVSEMQKKKQEKEIRDAELAEKACKLSKKESETTAKGEGICLHCDTSTDRRCSKCGNSYFCSRDCEVAARFVCCG